MLPSLSRRLSPVVAASALTLAACQGNIGNGGLPLQAPVGGFSPNAGAFAPTATRERTLEGAVYLTPELTQVPLPQLAGFGVALDLGTAPPSAEPGAASSTSPSASPAARHSSAPSATRTRLQGTRAVAGAAAVPSDSPVPFEPAPAATGSPASASSAAPSTAPSTASSGAASAAPSGAPASGTPHAATSPKPGSSPTPGPKIETKLVIYPDDAPALPTPAPTGSVQIFQHRLPIVRAFVLSHGADLPLYGLGAVRFTVPSDEAPSGRGFTIAVFEAKKKYRGRMVAFDGGAVVSGGSIESTLQTPLTLHKGVGYYLVLFGDQLAPTPLPSSLVPPPGLPPGYATPAANPYGSYPSGSPNPYATVNPYATPNPYGTTNPYAPPTPAPH